MRFRHLAAGLVLALSVFLTGCCHTGCQTRPTTTNAPPCCPNGPTVTGFAPRAPVIVSPGPGVAP
jgi:hypothetical protein